MKPKNFIRIVFLIAIVIVGVWWFMQQTTSTPEKTADATAPAKAKAPKTIAPPQIAKFLAPSVQSKSEIANAPSKPTETPPDPADPQTDLKTVIPDIARLYRAGDMAELYRIYTEPAQFDPVHLQELQTSQNRTADKIVTPSIQSRETGAQAYERLETQTPTFNTSGDEATYMLPAPKLSNEGIAVGETQIPLTFIKIDGKWYVKRFGD